MHTRYVSVRQGILALLAEEPRHGYQLKTEFERRTAGVWPLNVGQVYTTLDRLERDGLVEPVDGAGGGRNQRAYRLTEAGRGDLRRWLEDESPAPTPPRDDLVVKVLLAATADPAAALDIIAAQRTARFAVLQRRRRAQRQAAAAEAPDLARELVQDALAVRVEAELRWLDQCEARLREAASRSSPGHR